MKVAKRMNIYILLSLLFVVSHKSIKPKLNQRNYKQTNSSHMSRLEHLKGKTVLIKCNKSPNNALKSFDFANAFLYLPRLSEYLEKIGAKKVYIAPPKKLIKFFRTCSDLHVFSKNSDTKYISIECKDLLDNIPNFHKFESKKRYLSKNCTWANKEVNKLVKKIKESHIIPVLITRHCRNISTNNLCNPVFKYLNKRSITREEIRHILQNFFEYKQHKSHKFFTKFKTLLKNFLKITPKKIKFYNIQFEDQRTRSSPGTQKPYVLYPQYN